MVEGGEKPTRLAQKDIDRIRNALILGRVEPYLEDTDFTLLGVFQILDKFIPRYNSWMITPENYWSWELLQYDPATYRIRTGTRGDLLVFDKRNSLITPIPPTKIRIIDGIYEGIVQKSGYVLSNHDYVLHDYVLGEKQRVSVSEIEEILMQAEQGIEPPGFDYLDTTFAKVDPNLAGKSLIAYVFQPSLVENSRIWKKDGVVVDPDTRRLVRRVVSQPLVAEKWSKSLE